MIWVRDWIVFSFFMDMPPMRPQNAVLEVLDTIELPGSRQCNGILFFEDCTRIQIVTFKNSQYVGEKALVVPAELDRKLRAYMQIVRPAFGKHSFFI